MPTDQIRYDILVQEALRDMVRGVLAEVVKTNTLPGDHHFFITFDTTAEGVRLSERLRGQYPEEMTIVLQHQFWDLKVTDDTFEVGLSFGGVPEKLVVPLAAIRAFADRSVQFTLQFETLAENPDDAAAEVSGTPGKLQSGTQPEGKRRSPASRQGAPTAVPASLPAAGTSSDDMPEQPPQKSDAKPGEKAGAEVVRLDRFRKK